MKVHEPYNSAGMFARAGIGVLYSSMLGQGRTEERQL